MARYDVKEIAIWIILAYVVATFLNIILHYAVPSISIVKTGIGFMLILIAIVLVALFTFAKDGKFDKEERITFLIILAVMVGLYFIVRHFIPELFNILPPQLKEVFSFI